jgi:hypothetical protein
VLLPNPLQDDTRLCINGNRIGEGPSLHEPVSRKDHLMVTSSPAAEGASSLRSLFRAGAVCAGIAVFLYLVALVLVFATDLAPTTGGADLLTYIHENRTLYIVKQSLWVLPSVLLMISFLGLTVALLPFDRTWALVAGTIGVLSWAGTYVWPTTGEGSFVLLMLSDNYTAATTDAERVAVVAGAETMIAYNDSPAMLGVMQALGILLVSWVMLRGPFSRGFAWLGIATGAVGIVLEALRPWLGVVYSLYGILLFVWLIWLALALRQLSAEPDSTLAT